MYSLPSSYDGPKIVPLSHPERQLAPQLAPHTLTIVRGDEEIVGGWEDLVPKDIVALPGFDELHGLLSVHFHPFGVDYITDLPRVIKSKLPDFNGNLVNPVVVFGESRGKLKPPKRRVRGSEISFTIDFGLQSSGRGIFSTLSGDGLMYLVSATQPDGRRKRKAAIKLKLDEEGVKIANKAVKGLKG